MRLTLNYCTINDVMMVDPKKGDDQKKNRKVILHVDEEDFFDMLDSVNPKNIIKYLDMRKVPHREALEINVTDCTVKRQRASQAIPQVGDKRSVAIHPPEWCLYDGRHHRKGDGRPRELDKAVATAAKGEAGTTGSTAAGREVRGASQKSSMPMP